MTLFHVIWLVSAKSLDSPNDSSRSSTLKLSSAELATEAVRVTSSIDDLTSTSSTEAGTYESSTEVLCSTLLCEIEMLSSSEEEKSTDSNTSCGFIIFIQSNINRNFGLTDILRSL